MQYTARQPINYFDPNDPPIAMRETHATLACYNRLARYFVTLTSKHFTVTYTIETVPHESDERYKYIQITANVTEV